MIRASGLFFTNQKDILIIPLHKVLFPGVFFNGFGVGFQLIQLFSGGRNLLLVVFLAGLQLLELLHMPEMGSNKVTVVYKKYPDGKSCCSQEVFIFQPGRYIIKNPQVSTFFSCWPVARNPGS